MLAVGLFGRQQPPGSQVVPAVVFLLKADNLDILPRMRRFNEMPVADIHADVVDLFPLHREENHITWLQVLKLHRMRLRHGVHALSSSREPDVEILLPGVPDQSATVKAGFR